MAKDYGSWTLKQLKEELRKRNAKTTGKKAALVQRLMDYDTIFGGLVNDPEESYHIKTPDADLFRDVTSDSVLPLICEQDLQHYSQLADRENLKSSKNMYEEQYLQTSRVAYFGSEYFITALCSSEMRKSVTYNVTIKAKDNVIMEGQCECAAGMGPYAQCKHVLVLVYGLIDFTDNKNIKRSTSSTSTLQTFHHPTAIYSGNPVKAEDLNLKIKNAKKIAEFDPRPGSSQESSSSSHKYAEHFINQTINFCAQENVTMPMAQLRKPANKKAFYKDHDYFNKTEEERYLESLTLNEIELEELQQNTKNDRKLWKQKRKLRLQSSDFGKICKCPNNNKEKLAKALLKDEEFTSLAIQHGLKNEKFAIQKFCIETGFTVTKCGIIVHPDLQYFGCTPDGLVGDNAVIEVKCPYTARNKAATGENIPYLHLCEESGLFKLDKNSDYYYQVQGQLMCTNRNTAYFFVYTVKDFYISIIKKDNEFIQDMTDKLNHFYENFYKQVLLDNLQIQIKLYMCQHFLRSRRRSLTRDGTRCVGIYKGRMALSKRIFYLH